MDSTEPPKTGIRLNKYVANAGVCSRRKADELIANGEVQVNGEIIREMGYRVQEDDQIVYNGQTLDPETKIYILLNKPKNFITTTNDERDRKTVMELITKATKGKRVYPVGRLDRPTTGLLLFTNDGELAQKLAHPSGEVRKIYEVVLDRDLTEEDFSKLKHGKVMLEEGPVIVDDLAYPNPEIRNVVGIELHIGWNRVIRRSFEEMGYQVKKLDRVVYAGLTKLDLPRGKWRYLTEEEVRRLKHFKPE